MVRYDLKIEKQKIYGAEKIAVAANANKTVRLRFYFDPSWRIFDAKAAIFRTADNRYYIIEIKGNSVTVPWEALTLDKDFELSVVGYDGDTVLTAGKTTVRVVSSLLPEECKTLSPTETLFDRFREESLDEAFKKYESEIDSVTHSYESKLMEVGAKLNEANQNAENVLREKNEEIQRINQEHAAEVVSLQADIADIQNTLAETKIKAEKWDLVDAAIADKPRSNFALWYGGTKEYKLPYLNTANMSIMGSSTIDNYVSEIGLNVISVKSMDQVFMEKAALKKIELRNTQNVTSMINTFCHCPLLREVKLGDLDSCKSLKWCFANNSALEKVTFGNHRGVGIFTGVFLNCTSLKEISAELDFSFVTDVNDLFTGCYALKEVRFKENSIAMAVTLKDCQSLSKESMLSLFAALSSEYKYSLTVSRYAFDNNFPTEDEANEAKSFVTEKGWKLNLI